MKINEIAPFKSNPIYKTAKNMKQHGYDRLNDRFNKLELELINQGWKRLGKGSYGLVYEHPSFPYIFKIFYDDPDYFKYFNWARQRQNNPHVPKIKGKYIKINNKTYAVRMEKLEPLSSFNSVLKQYIDPELQSKSRLDISNYDDIDKLSLYSNLKFLKENFPDLYDIIHYVTANFPLMSQDLHGGNIMLRDDTIVITDPVATQ
jgi:hypothetical protein